MRDAAEDAYHELLLRPSTTTADGHRSDVENANKWEEALPNALANCIANHMPGFMADRVWLEDDADLRRLLEDGGGGDNIYRPTMTTTMTMMNVAAAAAAMQNYDLAYNLATYLLVTRASHPRSSVVDATNLLVHAERWDGSKWVVPFVHLFLLEIPPIRSPSPSVIGQFHGIDEDGHNGKNIIVMT
jgi:hypothetical protein